MSVFHRNYRLPGPRNSPVIPGNHLSCNWHNAQATCRNQRYAASKLLVSMQYIPATRSKPCTTRSSTEWENWNGSDNKVWPGQWESDSRNHRVKKIKNSIILFTMITKLYCTYDYIHGLLWQPSWMRVTAKAGSWANTTYPMSIVHPQRRWKRMLPDANWISIHSILCTDNTASFKRNQVYNPDWSRLSWIGFKQNRKYWPTFATAPLPIEMWLRRILQSWPKITSRCVIFVPTSDQGTPKVSWQRPICPQYRMAESAPQDTY